jgi:pimeloyl-ACP methyl ester carboxylesterase
VVVETLASNYEGEGQFGQRVEAEQYLRSRHGPVFAIYANPDRAASEATTDRHTYSRHLAWEGTGHWLHRELPDEFNALVLDWLARLPEE